MKVDYDLIMFRLKVKISDFVLYGRTATRGFFPELLRAMGVRLILRTGPPT